MTEKTTSRDEIIEEIVDRYGAEIGMLIPIMQDLQTECGYLPADALRGLAKRLDLPVSRLYAVATFYSSFRLAPKGLHEVTLCIGTVCYLKGRTTRPAPCWPAGPAPRPTGCSRTCRSTAWAPARWRR